MIKEYREKIKKHFREVLEIKTTPHEIALGFAIGTFFQNIPTLGIEILILLALVLIFKNLSKVSLVLAYLVWNPFITYPLAPVSYFVGNFMLGNAPIILIRLPFNQNLIEFTARYFLGSLIIALILAVSSYIVVFFLVKTYQKKEIPDMDTPFDFLNIEDQIKNTVS